MNNINDNYSFYKNSVENWTTEQIERELALLQWLQDDFMNIHMIQKEVEEKLKIVLWELEKRNSWKLD